MNDWGKDDEASATASNCFVECVSFLLVRDGQLLVERRKLTKSADPGAVAIPGGHIELGESQEEALIREIKEELNVHPMVQKYLCSLLHRDSNNELVRIHYFVIEAWQGAMANYEAEELLWIPLNQPNQIDIASDRTAVGEYVRLWQ